MNYIPSSTTAVNENVNKTLPTVVFGGLFLFFFKVQLTDCFKKKIFVLTTQDNIYILYYTMAVIRAEQFQANDVFSYLLQFIKII